MLSAGNTPKNWVEGYNFRHCRGICTMAVFFQKWTPKILTKIVDSKIVKWQKIVISTKYTFTAEGVLFIMTIYGCCQNLDRSKSRREVF